MGGNGNSWPSSPSLPSTFLPFLPFLPFMDLKGTVALLTGAKRIGAVVAEELARRGANIALCYARSRAEADAAIESFGKVTAAPTRVWRSSPPAIVTVIC